jgi:hypothetical protein
MQYTDTDRVLRAAGSSGRQPVGKPVTRSCESLFIITDHVTAGFGENWKRSFNLLLTDGEHGLNRRNNVSHGLCDCPPWHHVALVFHAALYLLAVAHGAGPPMVGRNITKDSIHGAGIGSGLEDWVLARRAAAAGSRRHEDQRENSPLPSLAR